MNQSHFDIIITGGGAAARIFLFFLSREERCKDLNILILEDQNRIREKTWCFWHKGEHPFQHLICKEWTHLSFEGKHFIKNEEISPYRYCCIKGCDFDDFFNNVFFPSHPNIILLERHVLNSEKANGQWQVTTDSENFTGVHLISNLGVPPENNRLYQHFHGWFIDVSQPLPKPETATLMDFSHCCPEEFCFFYVLPFSSTRVLVECTVYSTRVEEAEAYTPALKKYIEDTLGCSYNIVQKEYGAIPLIEHSGIKEEANAPIPIGQSAGMIKPSTGYAFQRMVEDSQLLAESFYSGRKRRKRSVRFLFYDRLLLSIIRSEPEKAVSIFHSLFGKRSIAEILTFLNEDTSIRDEMKIFMTLPWWPFIKRIPKHI